MALHGIPNQPPPLTGPELESIRCDIRSGIAPDLETAGRLVNDLIGLRESMLWEARRRELYEPAAAEGR